jgi:hypothetical protein
MARHGELRPGRLILPKRGEAVGARFGQRVPVPLTPKDAPAPPGASGRYAWGALGSPQYGNIPAQQARFAGDPPYELFFSQASITQSNVTAWRNAFPGVKVIAYLILFNLEAAPVVGSTYYDLVQTLDDRWLRKVSDSSKVLYQSFFGYYFWNAAMVTNVLIPWLQRSGTLLNWLTKYDGFLLDNLNYQAAYNQFEFVNAIAGGVKVAGVTRNELDLEGGYNLIPPLLAAGFRSQLSASQLIIPNAAAYSNQAGTVPIPFNHPDVNGVLWEPVENDSASTLFNGVANGWRTPYHAYQFVRDEARWLEILGFPSWPADLGFMQGGNMRPAGRLP